MKSLVLCLMLVLSVGDFSVVVLAAPDIKVQVGVGDPGDPYCSEGEDSDTTLVVTPTNDITQFFGTCNGVTFNSPSLACSDGDCPEVAAVPTGSTDQLVLRNTIIENTRGDITTITITYSNYFPTVDPNLDRYYGMSASGNFFRPPFDLATGDRFEMKSSVTYTKSSGTPVTEEIGGSIFGGAVLKYPSDGGLPAFGSVSLNDFTPQNPAQVTEKINCKLIGGGNNCKLGETITTVLTVVLGAGDSLSLIGSTHTPVSTNEACVLNNLDSLTGKIDVQPLNNLDSNKINPNDTGNILVALLGSSSLDVSSCGCNTAKFGPAETLPTNCDLPNNKPHITDVNNDQIPDAVFQFSTPDAEFKCGGDPVATLTVTCGFNNVVSQTIGKGNKKRDIDVACSLNEQTLAVTASQNVEIGPCNNP